MCISQSSLQTIHSRGATGQPGRLGNSSSGGQSAPLLATPCIAQWKLKQWQWRHRQKLNITHPIPLQQVQLLTWLNVPLPAIEDDTESSQWCHFTERPASHLMTGCFLSPFLNNFPHRHWQLIRNDLPSLVSCLCQLHHPNACRALAVSRLCPHIITSDERTHFVAKMCDDGWMTKEFIGLSVYITQRQPALTTLENSTKESGN